MLDVEYLENSLAVQGGTVKVALSIIMLQNIIMLASLALVAVPCLNANILLLTVGTKDVLLTISLLGSPVSHLIVGCHYTRSLSAYISVLSLARLL